jgi:serine acetyltransferase
MSIAHQGTIVFNENVRIGANGVVNKMFLEPSITIAGVPAKKIADRSPPALRPRPSKVP